MHEVTVAGGDVEVDVLPEVGGRIHRLRAFGREIIRHPADPRAHVDDPFFWGSYPMAPWCGRIDAAPTPVGGRTINPPSNFPDGTAIHGQVYAVPWRVEAPNRFRVDAGGDVGWPWPYTVGLEVEVRGATVVFGYRLTNRADDAMPGGIGPHPWFRKPFEIELAADAVFHDNLATTAEPVPVDGAWDLRRSGPMSDGLDSTWFLLGDPPVTIRWPDVEMTMRATAPSLFIVAASFADVDAVAVEPQTHAPQGIRRLLNGEPGPLAWLEPGTSLDLRVELAFRRRAR